MLSLAVIREACRLLDAGELSHRKIANQLGVSRGTIGALASGRRAVYGREPGTQGTALRCWDTPPERCRGCGATVFKPCLLCRAREYKARHQPLPIRGPSRGQRQVA